jgi:hypothetical protein
MNYNRLLNVSAADDVSEISASASWQVFGTLSWAAPEVLMGERWAALLSTVHGLQASIANTAASKHDF